MNRILNQLEYGCYKQASLDGPKLRMAALGRMEWSAEYCEHNAVRKGQHTRKLRSGLLALLLGARTLLGAPGITTRSILASSNKKLLGTSASLLVTSALLVVTMFAIRNKKLCASHLYGSGSLVASTKQTYSPSIPPKPRHH